MKRTFVSKALAGLLLTAASVWASDAILTGDAHTNPASAANNFGTLPNLNVGGGYNAFLQFSLATLPPGTTPAQISKATLVVYVNKVLTTGNIGLSNVLGGWTESGLSWTNQPPLGASVSAPLPVPQGGGYVSFDVTSLVQIWQGSPGANLGLAVTADPSNPAVITLDSKENTATSHPARLDIELASIGSIGPTGPTGPAGAVGPTGAVGPIGAAGVKGDPGATGPAGVNGAAGAVGPTGPAGIVGATGPKGLNGAAFFFSTLNLGQPPVLASTASPQWFAPNTPGNSTAFYNNTPSASAFQVQFPAACTASNLSVAYAMQSASVPGTLVTQLGFSQTVGLQVNGTTTALACTTAPTTISCNSATGVSIKAGDLVNMAILSGTVGDNNPKDVMTASFLCQ